MKKILVTILTVAMMTSAVAAFADGGPQGGPMGGPMDGQPPRMEQGQLAPEKPDAAPEKPTGEKPADAPEEPADLTGERPEMPSGEKPSDAPEMPGSEKQSDTGHTQKAPEKPSEAPEKPTGEKPADAPAEPEDLTGERPEMPSEKQSQAPTGEKPADAPEMSSGEQGQAPTGEKPTDAPEIPSGEQGQAPQGQAPQGQAPTGQQPTDGQQAPKMIDFDAMVTSGVISQETRDAIQAYMDEHKPEGEMPAAPGDGETPAEGEPSLLNDLLNAGIITQTEYDAMSAAA